VSSVRPLAYLAEDAVVLYPRVFGAPLSYCLRRPNGNLAQCLERAGSALQALHSIPEAVAGPLELHDFAAEIRQVVRATRPISALLPQVGAEIDALLDRARGLYERLPQEPPTFTHGDFKSDHLYVAPGRLTLIDFDTSRWADPALDVGKFLADLRLWYAFYNHPGLEQAHESFLAGYASGAPTEGLIRARLYEAVELVKLTARRIRLFEDNWASRTAGLVGHARALTDHLQSRLNVPGPVGGARGASDLSQTSRTYGIHCHPASAKGVPC
jgi:aminoglycoside phosphotransferase (APT) family kinase protein